MAAAMHGVTTLEQFGGGICSCNHDRKGCCYVLLCPPCAFGSMMEVVDPAGPGSETWCKWCCLAALCNRQFCSAVSVDGRARVIRKLTGHQPELGDYVAYWLLHCCCAPCAQCQEYRAVKNWKVQGGTDRSKRGQHNNARAKADGGTDFSDAVMAVPMQQAQTQTFNVTAPRGAVAGQQVQVHSPDGQVRSRCPVPSRPCARVAPPPASRPPLRSARRLPAPHARSSPRAAAASGGPARRHGRDDVPSRCAAARIRPSRCCHCCAAAPDHAAVLRSVKCRPPAPRAHVATPW